jgi:hypothetical protein
MKSYNNILLTANATIKEALITIDLGAMRIALIVDDKKN